MSNLKLMVFASILAGSVSLSAAAFADTTTTVSTTTVSGYSLPAGGTYVVVDPITGELRGAYDPTTRLLNGQPLPAGYFITDKITGRVIATVDNSGNIVDITSAPATTVLISSIDSRRAVLAQMITDSLTKGYITADQAAPLRAELDRLNALYAAANADGTMTLTEAFPIAYGLNNLSTRIVPLAHTTTVVTPIVGQRFLLENNVIVYADDTAFRRVQLERRIDDEYAAGRLSSKQVAELKKDLNDIAYMETRYTHHGEISSSNRKRIEKKFDEVKIDLDKDVAYINSRRSKIGIRVD